MKCLVPTLALIGLACYLPAVEFAPVMADRGANQYLQGSVLFEWLTQKNYNGDNQARDQFWLRAELGSKIELDDHIEINIVFGYDAEFGDMTAAGDPGTNQGTVFLNEGNILFKRFIRPELDVRFGRQPVNWNLRSGFGAFLYDSRANNPDVTSWDGIVAHYDLDNIILRPYIYNLNENNDSQGIAQPTTAGADDRRDNTLGGLIIDYEPQHASDNNIFFTANFSWEKNPIVDATTTGDLLATYYLGTEWNFSNGWDLYGEWAAQEGDLDNNTKFGGQGVSAGFNTHISMNGGRSNNTLLGVQYDKLSGDNGGSKYNAFVAPHEGVSDTLIVENERYGELSEKLVGNLEAIKARFEWSLGDSENAVLKLIGAKYTMPQTASGVSNDFGTEFDLSIDWQYSKYTTLKFFTGYFKPGDGYTSLPDTNDNKIMIYGASVEALF